MGGEESERGVYWKSQYTRKSGRVLPPPQPTKQSFLYDIEHYSKEKHECCCYKYPVCQLSALVL